MLVIVNENMLLVNSYVTSLLPTCFLDEWDSKEPKTMNIFSLVNTKSWKQLTTVLYLLLLGDCDDELYKIHLLST